MFMTPVSFMNTSFRRVVDTVIRSVEHYDLLQEGQRIVVALSGGKDSVVLSLVLKDLGFEITPVIVDMGYEANWADRVVASMRALGIESLVVPVRRAQSQTSGRVEFLQIQARVEVLDHLGTFPDQQYTPCTYCYSAKALTLHSICDAIGSDIVTFGHHATDAASSLIKEALMHIDRHDEGSTRFAISAFERLVAELSREAATQTSHSQHGRITGSITDLVSAGRVDTDEPPRSWLTGPESGLTIVRPMFDVPEMYIQEAALELGLNPEPSGCGHGATLATQTPRQMVHWRILQQAATEHFHTYIHELVTMGLTPHGWGRVNSRRRRAEFLGRQYKPSADGYDKL
jgi:hypothetical protein